MGTAGESCRLHIDYNWTAKRSRCVRFYQPLSRLSLAWLYKFPLFDLIGLGWTNVTPYNIKQSNITMYTLSTLKNTKQSILIICFNIFMHRTRRLSNQLHTNMTSTSSTRPTGNNPIQLYSLGMYIKYMQYTLKH